MIEIAGKKTYVDGIKFDSKFEAGIYLYFKQQNIKILEFQPQFILFDSFNYFNIKSGKECIMRNMKYTGDFKIELPDNNKPVIVEVKGIQTGEYMMRKKLFIMKYKNDYDFLQINDKKDLEFFNKYIKEEE